MNLVLAYCMVVGGMSAAAQVARGVVRGAGRLAAREPRAALVEVAGGLYAPLPTACGHLMLLGGEVRAAAQAMARTARDPSDKQPRELLATSAEARVLPTSGLVS